MLSAAVLAAAISFPLEWNSTYRTDIPYEVEVNPGKLGAKDFTVFADGKALASETLPGKAPGTVDLRFMVPQGTKRLTASGGVGRAALPGTASSGNNQTILRDLFAGMPPSEGATVD